MERLDTTLEQAKTSGSSRYDNSVRKDLATGVDESAAGIGIAFEPEESAHTVWLKEVENAAREALENEQSGPWMAEMARTFETRRDAMHVALNAIEGITCQKPGGAFYLFPNIAGVCDRIGALDAYADLPPEIRKTTSPATLFQMFALYHHHVAVMDRRSFGAIGTEGLHYLRISIAASLETLQEGVRRLAAAGSDVAGFQRFVAQGEHLA